MKYLLTLLFCASPFGADIGELRRHPGILGQWLVPGTFRNDRVFDALNKTMLDTTNSPVVQTAKAVISLNVSSGSRPAYNNSFTNTISAASIWFLPAATITSNTASAVLIGLKESSAANSCFGIGNNTGFLTGETITVVEWNSNRRTGVIGVNLSANRWNNLFFSWDDGLARYRIFLNGVEQTVVPSADGHAQKLAATSLYLGTQKADLSFPFNGWLGKITLYSVSFSFAEISALYKEGLR